jgi:hypothetical protein
VTVAAGALQDAGLIRYRRGVVTVVERLGVEAVSCECYRIIRVQYEQLLSQSFDRQLQRSGERQALSALA